MSKSKKKKPRSAAPVGPVVLAASITPAEPELPPASLPVTSTEQRASWRSQVFSRSGLRSGALIFALALLFGIGCRFFGLNWDDSLNGGRLGVNPVEHFLRFVGFNVDNASEGGKFLVDRLGRFVTIQYDSAGLHPDERFCTGLVPQLNYPTSWSEFFDSSRSPLNPDNLQNVHYVYGQLPLFIGCLASTLTFHHDPAFFPVLGRLLSALFDSGTVLFTFLIARRLFGGRWALFAASLVALAALHVQQSHFFVTDPYAAFFVTASFWAGTRAYQTGRARDMIGMGIFYGLAIASKISSVQFGIAVVAFVGLYCLRWGTRISPGKCVAAVLLCFVAALLAFRCGDPMAFRGENWGGIFDLRLEPRFWNDLQQQAGISVGDADVPFNAQWVGRARWLFSFHNLAVWGYGWPFMLSGALGFLLLFKRRSPVLLVGAVAGLVFFGVQGAAFSKFSRYMLPLTPFVALLAAHFWREIETTLRNPASRQRLGRYARPLNAGATLVVVLTALWCGAVTSIYAQPHTRIDASKWITDTANIPAGTTILQETAWDEGLPLWTTGPGQLTLTNMEAYDPDTPQKRKIMLDKLDAAQWIFVSSGRCWQNVPRWPQKWPMMTEYYRALFDGRLGFVLVKEFTSYPHIGPFHFRDDYVEEALTVYDHPHVMLFRKTEKYSRANTNAILSSVLLPPQTDWHPREASGLGADIGDVPAVQQP